MAKATRPKMEVASVSLGFIDRVTVEFVILRAHPDGTRTFVRNCQANCVATAQPDRTLYVRLMESAEYSAAEDARIGAFWRVNGTHDLPLQPERPFADVKAGDRITWIEAYGHA